MSFASDFVMAFNILTGREALVQEGGEGSGGGGGEKGE
jgi:hypothetical protein